MQIRDTRLKAVQGEAHPFCLVCSGSNPFGLALDFAVQADGSVTSSFFANPTLEGYPGLLHGGMVASLLDGAMTNCLFARQVVALTAELQVRYREPVLIGREILLRAWMEKFHPPLHFMRAELKQDDCVRATASAKFMARHV